jgi:hypothetical protein
MSPVSLPIVQTTPISVGEPKISGRTEPLHMHCQADNGLADYIVKLWANPQVFMGKHSLAREIYGSILASILGIDTPDISIVYIEQEFYQSQAPSNFVELLRQSIGANFGSKFIRGATIFSPPVTPSRHSAAVKVFCFDMLICNPDRRIGKPNVFQTSDGFMVFDHEQAFPFSRPGTIVGGFPPPWQYIKEGWHKNHIFYSSISNRECLFEIEEFVTSMEYLSEELFDTIEEQIPEDWRTGDDLQNIRLCLADTRDNVHLFKRSLQEILA